MHIGTKLMSDFPHACSFRVIIIIIYLCICVCPYVPPSLPPSLPLSHSRPCLSQRPRCSWRVSRAAGSSWLGCLAASHPSLEHQPTRSTGDSKEHETAGKSIHTVPTHHVILAKYTCICTCKFSTLLFTSYDHSPSKGIPLVWVYRAHETYKCRHKASRNYCGQERRY